MQMLIGLMLIIVGVICTILGIGNELDSKPRNDTGMEMIVKEVIFKDMTLNSGEPAKLNLLIFEEKK